MSWFWLLLVMFACCLCAWLAPKSELANSAARVFDSSVLMLSSGGGDDDDVLRVAAQASSSRGSSRVSRPERSPTLERYKTPSARVKRKRVTPFIAKKVGAL